MFTVMRWSHEDIYSRCNFADHKELLIGLTPKQVCVRESLSSLTLKIEFFLQL